MTRIISALLVTTALCGLLAITPARAASESASVTTAASSTVMSLRLTKKDITQIQNKLAEKGFFKEKVDGHLGSSTQDALRDYQSSEGIEANGYPTAATLEHLSVKTENDPVAGDNPPGKGGVVYTETIESKEMSATHTKPGSFANVDSPSPNGGSCLHCTNGPIGNGGTQSMRSNEY